MKISFNSESFDKLFCYATSIRESTLEFCAKEISAKEWLKIAYEKETKKVIRNMISCFGVDGTRTKMRRLIGRHYTWMGDYK